MNRVEELERACEGRGMYLVGSSFKEGYYTVVRPGGTEIMEHGMPCERLTGYHTPEEIAAWLDGYDAAMNDKKD